MKCFGNSKARSQLSPDKVFKSQPDEALIAFKYFKNLRNKHFIHDENSHAQSLPGAILNDGRKSYKIEKIICFSAIAATLEQSSYGNLKLLVENAQSFVKVEFDELCNTITTELESETYEELIMKESVKYTVPTNDELDKNRNI